MLTYAATPCRTGSISHRDAFCHLIIDAHERYDTSGLTWPDLSPEQRATLSQIPIWAAAIGDEGDTGCMQKDYADSLDDPLVRHAIATQALEEQRHARIFRSLLARYDIPSPQEPRLDPATGSLEAEFIRAGYRECMDVALGYGFYRAARRAALFPEEFFDIFDRFLDEESRHIVFFVNWMAYRRTRHDPGATLLSTLRGYTAAAARLKRSASAAARHYAQSSLGRQLGAKSVGELLRDCAEEHRARMTAIPQQLLRPKVLPVLTGLLAAPLRMLKLP